MTLKIDNHSVAGERKFILRSFRVLLPDILIRAGKFLGKMLNYIVAPTASCNPARSAFVACPDSDSSQVLKFDLF